jgi:hypothetical protein
MSRNRRRDRHAVTASLKKCRYGLFQRPVREMLIYSAFPAAQGCGAEIDDGKSLISKPGENHIFAAASAEKARMALFSVSSDPGYEFR